MKLVYCSSWLTAPTCELSWWRQGAATGGAYKGPPVGVERLSRDGEVLNVAKTAAGVGRGS
jgi:hypothetical protein